VVDPDLCVVCGICAGACPTSTPFRRMSDLVPGIDLPDRTIASLRDQLEVAAARLKGTQRIVVFGCDHGVPIASAASDRVATPSTRWWPSRPVSRAS
jgi:Fe-S-cluster-containing hydrogenase component 2